MLLRTIINITGRNKLFHHNFAAVILADLFIGWALR
jgi:hypothetical protein